jgi:hypothetical protein
VAAAHVASTLYGEARDQVGGQMLSEIRTKTGLPVIFSGQ